MGGTRKDSRCGTCSKPFKEDPGGTSTICCDICDLWFHIQCVGVEQEAADIGKKYKYLYWYCPPCSKSSNKFLKNINNLNTEQVKIQQELASIKSRVTSIEVDPDTIDESQVKEIVSAEVEELKKTIQSTVAEEIAKLKIPSPTETQKNTIKSMIDEEINNLKLPTTNITPEDNLKTIKSLVSEEVAKLPPPKQPQNAWNLSNNSEIPDFQKIVSEEIHEREELEKVKMNLIISGIAESTPEQEKQDVVKLLQDELDIEAHIEGVERCGKRIPEDSTKPRLLKLRMKIQENRKNILRNAPKLRKSSDQHVKENVYISPDLTRKQQKDAKNLREERRERKRQEPEKTFLIKRGKVVEA